MAPPRETGAGFFLTGLPEHWWRATLTGMNIHQPKPDKYKAYRARKKAAGLRQVRIWTLDPEGPGFRESMNAAFACEQANPEARDLQDGCDANAAEIWRDLPA